MTNKPAKRIKKKILVNRLIINNKEILINTLTNIACILLLNPIINTEYTNTNSNIKNINFIEKVILPIDIINEGG